MACHNLGTKATREIPKALGTFPSTVAAWERRLFEHRTYGAPLRNWRDRRAISRKAKVSAVVAMSAGVVFTWLAIVWPWVLISIAVLGIAGSWIWTRNE